jgi:rfaE bifunctional protein nucleotidyltransferase chain/domain
MLILPEHIRDKILEPGYEDPFSKDFRSTNKIVFTNGCFDLLHSGHLHLLSKAKEMGTILVIGLNSDASVKRLKGISRPVQDQETRQSVLAFIEIVDYVALFNEDTPEKLIQIIRPDILVKGGDYSVEKIVGYDFVSSYGGKIVTIPLLHGFSTSQLIDKYKKG